MPPNATRTSRCCCIRIPARSFSAWARASPSRGARTSGTGGGRRRTVPEVLEAAHHFEPHSAAWLEVHESPRLLPRAASCARGPTSATTWWPTCFIRHATARGALHARTFPAMRNGWQPGGLLCQWPVLPTRRGDAARRYTHASEVFPHTRAFLLRLNIDTPVLGLIATLEPIKYPPGWFEQRVRDAALRNT